MISPNKPAPTCLRTHLYTHTVKVYARACDPIFFLFTFKEQKRVSLSPARVASSVTETYPFLPCVRLVLAPVSSLGLATNKCSKNGERDSTGDHGQHSSRRSVSLVAPRTSALQTAERFTVRTGAARPLQVKVESRSKTARRS